MSALLAIEDLAVSFATPKGPIMAVDGVDLSVDAGETLCLVGESGCGKSVTCLAILGLLAANGRVAGGHILFDGRDLAQLSERELEAIRGRDIAMVFQDPLSALNPIQTVGRQIIEALRLHRAMTRGEALSAAEDLLARVGIPAPRDRLGAYPHQLSGGMNQRVMIAMALACRPRLIIADEPTTALDVTIQAQILDLLRHLVAETSAGLLLITHDLGVVAEMADRVAVMYLGRVVETALARPFFAQPMHPYSHGLMRSLPRIDCDVDRLQSIGGFVPSLHAVPSGCAFAPRCPSAAEPCRDSPTPVAHFAGGARTVTCRYPLAS